MSVCVCVFFFFFIIFFFFFLFLRPFLPSSSSFSFFFFVFFFFFLLPPSFLFPSTSSPHIRQEVEILQNRKKQRLEEGAKDTEKDGSDDKDDLTLVVPFNQCLNTFFSTEIVELHNPSLGPGTVGSAKRTTLMGNTHTHMHIYLYAHTHTHTYTLSPSCTHTRMQMHMHTHAHSNAHTHICTHMRMHSIP